MKAVLALLVVCIVSAVSAQDRRATWIAPASADARQNPVARRADVLPGGRKMFEQRCRVCHRADGTGTTRGPNLAIARVLQQSDGALYWKISSGNTRTGMPSFSFLPESQRWQLVAYIRSLGN
jgi:mono/diheme cytochrome c family protein